jgi:hypothetical protein
LTSMMTPLSFTNSTEIISPQWTPFRHRRIPKNRFHKNSKASKFRRNLNSPINFQNHSTQVPNPRQILTFRT